MLIVAGDIGGTHTRLAIFNGKKIVKEKKYLSQQFSELSQVLQDFLTEKVDCGLSKWNVNGLGIKHIFSLDSDVPIPSELRDFSDEKSTVIG